MSPKPRHGHTWRGGRTPEYEAWAAMNRRCTLPTNREFKNYGGRGIAVAAEWSGPGGFERFLAHVGPRPSSEHSLDRIDNERGYHPGNVRWATREEQNANKRTNRTIVVNGETLTVAQAARRFEHQSKPEQTTGDTMTRRQMIRQGDVLLIPVPSVPANIELVARDARGIVLAEGETSGHHHGVTGRGCKLFRFRDGRGDRLLTVGSAGAVVEVVGGGSGGVPRHEPVRLGAGAWTVRVQRSWTSANAARRVED